jgi:uncharacterized protein YkwD
VVAKPTAVVVLRANDLQSLAASVLASACVALLMSFPCGCSKRRVELTAKPTPSAQGSEVGLRAQIGEQENELLGRINEVRARGASCPGWARPATSLPPFRRSETLARAAKAYSAEIAKTGVFSHESLEGLRPGSRAARAGYTGRDVVENLAWGQLEPEQVVAAWLASPSHCQALLSAERGEAGVGFASGSEDKPIWVFLAGSAP